MKAATVVIEEKENSILSVKGHESAIEARAYCFDEIIRLATDYTENNKVTVQFYEDIYGEWCMEISPDGDVDSKVIVKTMYETEEENNDKK